MTQVFLGNAPRKNPKEKQVERVNIYYELT